MIQQQAFVLYFADTGHTNLPELNSELSQGYQVVSVTPMSGTGETGHNTPNSDFPFSRAVVILSKVVPSSPGGVANFQPSNPLQ